MPKCEVCKKESETFVASSSCGAISFAYCKECLNLGAEPYGALVAYLSCAVSSSEELYPENSKIRPGYQEIINATLKVSNKDRQQFYLDIDKSIKEYNNYVEGI